MRISNGMAEIQITSPLRGNRKVYINPVYNENPVQKVKGLAARKTPIEAPKPLFEKPGRKSTADKAKSAYEAAPEESTVYTFSGQQRPTQNFSAGLNFDTYA